MATSLSDIKHRIGTTAQIRKVTGTLQKIAAAKLAQDQRRLENADTYFLQLCNFLRLANSALPSGADTHPLMKSHAGNTIALIVFGSDRGLCGAFNSLLVKSVTSFINRHSDKTVSLLFRGKVTFNRAARLHHTPLEYIESTTGLGDRMLASFMDRSLCEVHVMYWNFFSVLNQEIREVQVLPTPFTALTDAAPVSAKADNRQIEPSPQALIESLLPEYIRRSIYNAFYNSVASENAQRQTSMSRATENAGDMLTELRKSYSRLRQESITTEMLEIVAGMNR